MMYADLLGQWVADLQSTIHYLHGQVEGIGFFATYMVSHNFFLIKKHAWIVVWLVLVCHTTK